MALINAAANCYNELVKQLQKTAYIYALLAALLWGSTAATVKLLGMHLNNIQILFYTSAIAVVSLLVVAITQKKLHYLAKYGIKDYCRFAYLSLLGVFLYYLLLYQALHLVPGQEAFVVNYTWPIWTVIFAAIFIKEDLNARKILALVISFVGVAVVITRGSGFSIEGDTLYGNSLAMLAAMSYGAFSVLTKKYGYERVTSTMIYYAFSFVYVAVYLAVTPQQLTLPTQGEWVGLLWLGVFTSGIAFVLWQTALKHGDVTKMANIIFITPFLSLIYLAALAGESINLYSLLGATLIVSGAILQNILSTKKKTVNESPL